MAESLAWLEDGTPASPRFEDRYRSSVGHGRAQAEQVFFAGCGLPQVWQGQSHWRMLENGFGLGLNFLVSWQAWRQDPQRPALLHYTATEAFIVGAADLLQACRPHPDLMPLAEQLARSFEGLLPGVHRLSFEGGRVLLTLLIGPAERMLRTIDGQFDSVYLDGFAPDRNPHMWSAELLRAIGRRCRRGSLLASWCVARSVVDALAECGFEVRKVEGLAPKRHQLRASYQPTWQPRQSARSRPAARAAGRALVIGAGLAGSAVAASLGRRGWHIKLLEADRPSAGASGLPVAMLAPHVSPDDGLLSRWSRAGVRSTWSEARRLLRADLDYSDCGVLQKRWDATGALPPAWPEAGHFWSQTAGAMAGVGRQCEHSAIWHASGGWIRPAALVEAWLQQAGLEPQCVGTSRVEQLQRQDGQWLALDASGRELGRGDLLVLANASDCMRLLASVGLGLEGTQILRGQVSWAPVQPGDVLPAVPVNGHGHLVPRFANAQGELCWQFGASFDRDQTGLQPSAQSHADNLSKLAQLLPDTANSLAHRKAQAWVGLRLAYKDHLPLIGPLDESRWPGLWLSTAYGSRGLSSTALAAELIAAWLHDEPLPVEGRLAQAVWAGRVMNKPS
jgi:tRNA 5-methylaminomethyl-2-thiouridine biosynthesis bifunctional protein